MNIIKSKQVEPVQIFTGSTFKLKIEVARYVTYEEVRQKTYNDLKKYSYSNLRGD